MSDITANALFGAGQAAQPLPDTNLQTADPEFFRLLQEFDAAQETAEERQRRQAQQAQQAAQLRQRANQLHGRIAQLRSRVAAGGTPADAAQLSALQTQLFWLLASS